MQHEWPPTAADLVVELQAVHRCVRHTGYDGTRPANSSRTAAQETSGSVRALTQRDQPKTSQARIAADMAVSAYQQGRHPRVPERLFREEVC